ncbi:MAG: ABC transporter ATP-binding protein, partial [bacterium]|nr:ABC transporter ATP-binding protein [bacterium]
TIISKTIDDVDVIQMLISGPAVQAVTGIITITVVSVLLFFNDWRLALVTLAVLPLYVLNFKIFIKRIKGCNLRNREKMDEIMGDVQEKISGVQVVKAFSMERQEVEYFTTKIREKFGLGLEQGALGSTFSAMAIIVSGLGTALVLWLGGLEVRHGLITIGDLLAFNTLIGMLYTPALQLSELNDAVQQAVTSLERIFELMDTKPDITEKPHAYRLPPIQGAVSLKNVTFGYLPDQTVLHDICLEIEPGQMAALVGHTGSGKSSIINLLPRFYDIRSGSIEIDGHDIRDVQVDSLRDQIGIVLQEPLLFNISIKENIAYGRLEASMEEVIEAANSAEIHDFIQTLPQGYDTCLGDEGIKISMGEKQRIAIARAILKQPRVLILDEATSALDSLSETLIQTALDKVMKGRTSIVIAHRLSTILNADKIAVLDDGRIVQLGTHDELLHQEGPYRRFYEEQFMNEAIMSRPELREALLNIA